MKITLAGKKTERFECLHKVVALTVPISDPVRVGRLRTCINRLGVEVEMLDGEGGIENESKVGPGQT